MSLFYEKYLHMSKKSSTFAAEIKNEQYIITFCAKTT